MCDHVYRLMAAMKITIISSLLLTGLLQTCSLKWSSKPSQNLFKPYHFAPKQSTVVTAAMRPKQQSSNLPDLSQSRFPPIPDDGYDLIIIGSGPAGEAAAVRASQLGARVAVIEKKSTFGGPTGLTSKAIREAANRICKAIDQIGGDRKKQIKALWKRSFPILKTEAEVLQAKETRNRLTSNGVDMFIGSVEFVDSDAEGSDVTLRICRPTECVEVRARHAAIASGSRPNRPPTLRSGVALPFLKGRVVTASEMALVALPTSIAIIGGGVIAVEYATVFAQLGVGVSLICTEEEFLPFLEKEIRQSLRMRMSREHILFVRESVREIQVGNSSIGVVLNPSKLQIERDKEKGRVAPERRLKVDLVLYSGGRNANSEGLGLEAVNVSTSKYGRIVVDQTFRTTSRSSIFAIGDVIGPPGLASAAQQHGRSLSEMLFGVGGDDEVVLELIDNEEFSDERDDFFSHSDSNTPSASEDSHSEAEETLFGTASGAQTMDAPLTLWTLPEIASVGVTLAQASGDKSKLIVEGRAFFKDMARGRLSGDSQGYVKIIARLDAKRHTIIGVHIIGEGANELIQLGSILVHSGASLESVSRTPFAAVTLSGIYQMACDDALLKSPRRKKSMHSPL